MEEITDVKKLVILQTRSMQQTTLTQLMQININYKSGVLSAKEAKSMSRHFYDLLSESMLEIGEKVPGAIMAQYKEFLLEYTPINEFSL